MPKGRKAWALLAYLASADVPASREQLAGLLFPDADDPLGALRWNLAQLRRLLGAETLKGQLISLPTDAARIDTRVVRSGSWPDALPLPGLGRDLLEGMQFPGSPAFEAWFLNERRHLSAATEAILREAALAQLGAGKPQAAIDIAANLVASDPLNEEHQALLIRSYASAGDTESAGRQLTACTDLFRRELGVEPGPGVLSATRVSTGSVIAPSEAGGEVAARAQLDAGRAAIDAGALEAGLECFRRAIAEAHSCGSLELKAEALSALGSALVHSGRRVLLEEGSAALHEALALIERTGQRSLAAAAKRELGWRDFLAARYDRAEKWLKDAEGDVGDDRVERAWILTYLACCLSDMARYEDALKLFEEAIELAETAGDRKRVAYALNWLGRLHLLRGDLDRAEEALQRSVDIVKAESWIGFQPMPESFFAQVKFSRARTDEAKGMLEHAFALGCRLGDSCYESAAASGLGRLARHQGDLERALGHLRDARTRLVERPDYVWLEAYALEGMCDVAATARHPSALVWIDELTEIASRGGMKELLARAYLHRSRLGHDDALDVARVIAADVDNPLLSELIDREVAATA